VAEIQTYGCDGFRDRSLSGEIEPDAHESAAKAKHLRDTPETDWRSRRARLNLLAISICRRRLGWTYLCTYGCQNSSHLHVYVGGAGSA